MHWRRKLHRCPYVLGCKWPSTCLSVRIRLSICLSISLLCLSFSLSNNWLFIFFAYKINSDIYILSNGFICHLYLIYICAAYEYKPWQSAVVCWPNCLPVYGLDSFRGLLTLFKVQFRGYRLLRPLSFNFENCNQKQRRPVRTQVTWESFNGNRENVWIVITIKSYIYKEIKSKFTFNKSYPLEELNEVCYMRIVRCILYSYCKTDYIQILNIWEDHR